MGRRRKYPDGPAGCLGCLGVLFYFPFGVIFELAKKYK